MGNALHITSVRHVPSGAEPPKLADDDPYIAFLNKLKDSSRTKHIEHHGDFTDPEDLFTLVMTVAEQMYGSNKLSGGYTKSLEGVGGDKGGKKSCCAVQ